MRQVEQIRVEFIEALPGRRPINPDAVDRLAASIKEIGLRTPITVRIVDNYKDSRGEVVDGQPILVTGANRLAAVRKLGWEHIECFVFDDDDEIAAQLWEISENLHRAELTEVERASQVSEWVRLTEERRQTAQVAPIESKRDDGKGHRPESGIRAASRELGIDRDKVRRSIAIASLPEEAKEVAREVGLDNNQSALLRASKSADPTAELRQIKAEKEAPKTLPQPPSSSWTDHDEDTYTALLDAWHIATQRAKQRFLSVDAHAA